MLTDPYLLVIASGAREYREHHFRSLADSNVWLFADSEPTWQTPYISGYTLIPDLSIAKLSADFSFLSEAVDALLESASVKGVLTFEEAYLPAACQIAERLGLPSLGSNAAENCRNKERTRQILTDAGVPQPRFAVVKTAAEAASCAARFGYPVVLKPRGLAGSVGVVKVRSARDIEAGFRIATSAGPGPDELASDRLGGHAAERHGAGVLLEEFLDGTEVAVDSAVVGGRLEPLYIVRKRFGPEPFFEETGQTVNADDPLLHDDELIETLRTGSAALGLRDGMTHIEVKLTAAGPTIVEVNGRLAGDFVPHIAKLATGVDGVMIAARIACGETANLKWGVKRSAAHQIIYADRDGTFNAIKLPSAEKHSAVVAAGPLAAAGTRLTLPPRAYMMARCGYVIVAADSADECDAALVAAVADVSVDLIPSAS